MTLAYAVALAAALILFALLALGVVDRAQRLALDTRLESTAGALRIVGDADGGRLTVDARDKAQFDTIVGSKFDAAIFAPDGSVLVTNDVETANALAAQAVDGQNRFFTTTGPGGARLRAFTEPITLGATSIGFAATWSDIRLIESLDRSVAAAFAIAIPLIVAIAVLAGGEIARRGLAPLDRIATIASEIEAHDLARRLALTTRTDELGRLGATFDRMLDRLKSAFERERRFTSDASHELRAPLSVIRAEADLALRTERTPAEYQRALETIAGEADALEALTRDLLAAARNSNGEHEVRGSVDLAVVAAAAAERLRVLPGAQRVRVEAAGRGDAVIEANRTLIERAVLGVLHNALKHAPQEGCIAVSVANKRGNPQLVVRDDGPGFSQAALAHGFERFWRDDPAGVGEGSGLGLSLAKAIVERYGGTISLSNAEPHGAVVSMVFPSP